MMEIVTGRRRSHVLTRDAFWQLINDVTRGRC